ncbi:MAG: hypothetical protein A2528_02460 [Candidatus Staskawiczbacteria bacterium RIFOXYD2_FULL_37_9]|uniref:Uncharacterized protein n=1 Tax=Candidatus Staskawiczbacteria bacterium RIFOXYB1_FULL_37_44 TaxID=1802223 RepID=A0A1G2IV00_9BACT|nr:MAG: hypothetical protein A2358_02145 [Candidatus Staskawiczbacteria bacterium RIFOXYB1_FULL_37_44]OGZ82791.1 MAG: hypothetical protein A2416_03125 [Candidatus Staskawiczbacteria bacterium RIFOXYC1_FULL_37_52]OGZ87307.1 MAG: hypothetical protein A2444_02275 [Candidatus Staskawiczbacteria bacterium RIFOXYC2_FULL_37_19]OGZ90562.1 MAG: hypothetical protein A2581_02585 [Candidatus Staskawiczbacteria bacterium RIFOXYD1_FULL_37_110]OGZ94321.1 MAG: hypothetical protein A2528_02460 [Candidatus Stask
MNVHKCDFCKKEIDKERIIAGTDYILRPAVELCYDCGKPILNFLKKHKLIDKNNKQIKEI